MEKTYSEILSDIEKAKIIAFNNDVILREAVRKVLLAGIYDNGTLKAGEPADPTKNFALRKVFRTWIKDIPVTNEELGEELRASAMGIQLLEAGFDELSRIKEETTVTGAEENPAL